MNDQENAHRAGLLQSAMEELQERTRAVANLVGSVGSEALGVIPEPVSAPVTRMLNSLQQFIDLAPPFIDEFEVLVEELHAQRLTVQALQAELSAFDHQMGLIEKSLAPLESWIHQWSRLRQSLAQTPEHPAAPKHPAGPEPGSSGD